MQFSGWQKVSLSDYPKKISSVLFTSICNFDCAYCHNPDLKKIQPALFNEEQVVAYLSQHRQKIQALVVSGGEPTLWGDALLDFFQKVKTAFPALRLKLDTNGSDPEFLEMCLELNQSDAHTQSILDFLALDFKSLDYALFSDLDMSRYAQSLSLLHLFPESELRITMFPPYIPQKDFQAIANYLSAFSIPSVAIQTYRPTSETLRIQAYDDEVLAAFQKVLHQHGLISIIR